MFHTDDSPLQPSRVNEVSSEKVSTTEKDECSPDEGQDRVMMPTSPSSSIRKFLSYPPIPSEPPTLQPKSCGRVLTSAECLQDMEEKQKQKKIKAQEKEERKQKREEGAKAKQKDAEA